ncbi:MAG: family oxidoreductase [Sediminibacterium sp.]|nr:family oxidoreductase [Sediminibacterium sp.]
MPGDTLRLNHTVKDKNTYDAIIVGSGISGGWAAKELCEKGLKVLLLERGKNVAEHPVYPTANMDPWEFTHRNSLSRDDKKDHAIQTRHYSYREDNKHFYINDTENPYDEINRFDWVRGDIVGGRSLLWGRACYRWSDHEFESNLKDGHGVDWPIRYKDIAPWYDYVERFAGISGNKDGLDVVPDGQFQPPFEMNCVEKDFKTRLESKYHNRNVIIGRTANLTQPVNGRTQCQVRNLCHRGCPFGAYFSTNASTMPAAIATGNLTVRPGSLVTQVLYNEQKQKASGVEIIDTETKKTETFYAKIIFLNASTVATAAILLRSTSHRFPNGLGNGSDQVGRNLMDHHKGISIFANVDGFEDKYYYGRRPNPLFIPKFRNIKNDITPAFLRGYHMNATAARETPEPAAQIGADFKEALTEPGGWKIRVYGYGECLPYPDNRITLNKEKKDPWGLSMLTIDCTFRENEKKMHDDMVASGIEMLTSLGYQNVTDKSAISAPGNANHEMGTVRMGRDPKTSVLNGFNQMHEVPNVFVTDGSSMASSSCINPSITYMALTARACDYAVKELGKGDL